MPRKYILRNAVTRAGCSLANACWRGAAWAAGVALADSVTGMSVLFGLKGIRRPQGHGVAFAVQERLQGFFGRHIFDGDLFLSQAEGFQPLVHGIVRGGACGAQDGFPAYRAPVPAISG